MKPIYNRSIGALTSLLLLFVLPVVLGPVAG